MRRLLLACAFTSALSLSGSLPSATAEGCLHGIYIDPVDLKPYACPWGGGTLYTSHGEVHVDSGGIIVADSGYAYGVPDLGGPDEELDDTDEPQDSE